MIDLEEWEARRAAGWLSFGTSVDYPGPIEFSEEVGEDGLPLWERRLPHPLKLYVVMAGDKPWCGGGSSTKGGVRAFQDPEKAKRSLRGAKRSRTSYDRATHLAVFELKEILEEE